MAYSAAPDTLDPQATLNISTQQYSTMVFDNLTSLDEKNQALPNLALQWTPEKQGQEWVFDLRQGVHFHHGTEFTADDVVATIERAYDKSLALNATGAFGPLQKAQSEGRYKVRLILTQPFGELPITLANRWARILPKDRIDQIKTAPSGTGPFRLTDFQPGASITMARNPDYWMKGRPYLDGARLVVIREAVAQQAALRSGDVDFISSISAEAFLALRAARGIRAYSTGTGVYQPVMLQANLPPFDNVKVREAFRYILDRKALLASAVFGQGRAGQRCAAAARQSVSVRSAAARPGSGSRSEAARRCRNRAAHAGFLVQQRTAAHAVGRAGDEGCRREDRCDHQRAGHSLYGLRGKRGAQEATVYRELVGQPHALQVSLSRLLQQGAIELQLSGNQSGPGRPAGRHHRRDRSSARKQLVAQALTKIHDTSDRVIPYFLNYLGATSDKVQGFVPPQYDMVDVRPIWLSQ